LKILGLVLVGGLHRFLLPGRVAAWEVTHQDLRFIIFGNGALGPDSARRPHDDEEESCDRYPEYDTDEELGHGRIVPSGARPDAPGWHHLG